MTDFDPRAYWDNRAPHWVPPTSRVKEKENLFNWLDEFQPQTILDVGSGDGDIFRLIESFGFPFLLDHTMADFSDEMRYTCLDRTGILPDSWDGQTLPYDDSSFELVLSFSVLLHVPPSMINQVLAEHVRVSSRHVFIATSDMEEMASAHCFPHRYSELFRAHNLKVLKGMHWPNTRVHYLLEKSG